MKISCLATFLSVTIDITYKSYAKTLTETYLSQTNIYAAKIKMRPNIDVPQTKNLLSRLIDRIFFKLSSASFKNEWEVSPPAHKLI